MRDVRKTRERQENIFVLSVNDERGQVETKIIIMFYDFIQNDCLCIFLLLSVSSERNGVRLSREVTTMSH